MKKIFLLITTAFLIILLSCDNSNLTYLADNTIILDTAGPKQNENQKNYGHISLSEIDPVADRQVNHEQFIVTNSKIYYRKTQEDTSDQPVLTYTSVLTGETAPFCTDPLCKHDTPFECTANFEFFTMSYHDGWIYVFSSTYNEEKFNKDALMGKTEENIEFYKTHIFFRISENGHRMEKLLELQYVDNQYAPKTVNGGIYYAICEYGENGTTDYKLYFYDLQTHKSSVVDFKYEPGYSTIIPDPYDPSKVYIKEGKRWSYADSMLNNITFLCELETETGYLKGHYIFENISTKFENNRSNPVYRVYNILTGETTTINLEGYGDGSSYVYNEYFYFVDNYLNPDILGHSPTGHEVYKANEGKIYRTPIDGSSGVELVAEISNSWCYLEFIYEGTIFITYSEYMIDDNERVVVDSHGNDLFAIPLDSTGMVYPLEEYIKVYNGIE